MLDFITKESINKGWSGDKKYCVTTADGTKYLLRVTPFEKSANRENMYRMQKEVEKQAVEMFDILVEQMKVAEGVTENLKELDQMEWLQRMGNIEAMAREVVCEELIYV